MSLLFFHARGRSGLGPQSRLAAAPLEAAAAAGVRDEAWPALPLAAARSLAAASLETAAAAGAYDETQPAPPLYFVVFCSIFLYPAKKTGGVSHIFRYIPRYSSFTV